MKSPRRSQYTILREVVRDFFAQLRVVCLAPSSKPSNHVDASGGVSDAPDDARIAAYRAGTSRSSSSNFRRKKCSEASFAHDFATEATGEPTPRTSASAPPESLPPVGTRRRAPRSQSFRDPRPTARSRPPHPAIPTCLGVFLLVRRARASTTSFLYLVSFGRGGANASGGSAAAAVSAYS